jgi:hypothetical protein
LALMRVTQDAHHADAVRDTIAGVFAGDAYNRSARQTIGGYLLEAFGRLLNSIFRALNSSPEARSFALWAGFGLLALIVGRVLYVAITDERRSARRSDGRATGVAGESAWVAAQRAAAAGDYTQAAHWLYAALLQSLAQRERLPLHSSKTAGDYARDLRARSSPSWSPFRKFVQAFEFVAYGRRECNREEFERLRALAEPVMGLQR